MTTEPFKVIHYNKESDSFVFDEERFIEEMVTNTIDEGIEDLPVAIFSVAGPTRHGKSFLMNFFLRYLQHQGQDDWIGGLDEPLTGFLWEEGCDAVTEGIVASRPFIVTRKDGSRIVVILMDTQGLFDDHTDPLIAEQFFSISNIISSTQIYNLKNNILSSDITVLSKYSEHSKELSIQAGQSNLQKLLFIIRDWPNAREFDYGFIGGEHYLQHKRDNQKETFWKEWYELSECFSDIQCFLMATRGDEAEDIDFKGQISKLKPKFVDSIKELVSRLLVPENIAVKSEAGEEMPFRSVFNLFKELCVYLSEHKRIDELELIKFKAKIQDAFGSARFQFLDRILEAHKAKKDMDETSRKAEKEALDMFKNATQSIPGLDDLKSLKEIELINFFADIRDSFNLNPSWQRTAYRRVKTSLYNVNWSGVGKAVLTGVTTTAVVGVTVLKYLPKK